MSIHPQWDVSRNQQRDVTRDRAAVVTTAVLQILMTAPWCRRRQQLELLLRDEFADERRQAIADRSSSDA
jgi:hypothetical protein